MIDINEILDRKTAPKSGKPRDVNFPGFFETRTKNGITILVIEDRKLPLITTRFVYKSGAYLDYFSGKDKSGLASMTTELLSKGTLKRNATQIAEETDYLGATLSSGCDYNATYVSSYSLRKFFDKMFDIISDILLSPKFDEEELLRVKEQRINSLLSMKDEGDYLAEKVFRSIVYENTPYGFPIEGNEKTLQNISREDIGLFYKNVFNPSNLIIAFVGDITPEEAIKKTEEKFSEIEDKSIAEDKILIPAEKKISKVYLTEKTGAVQSSLKIGHKGISRSNPDFIVVNVMNTILGGYFTSRLNKNLREVNGYTYGVRSSFSSNLYAGDFSVMTEVKNNITGNTLKEIIKEFNEIRNTFAEDEELQNVKNYISGSFPFQLETPNSIASKVINLKLNNLENDYYNTYINKVNALTKEDIKRAANEFIHPDKLVISISGNVKEIKDDLANFGEVQITDE